MSKVTYDYSKYFRRHSTTASRSPRPICIYSIAQSWELAYDEERIQIETALGVTSRPFLETFKGFRLLEDDRLETYVDFWHFEPSYIASYAIAGGVSTPWEMLYAMDDVVFSERRGAYSDTAAAHFSVPWLSLVTETDARTGHPRHATFLGDETFPEAIFNLNGRKLVTVDDAKARYQACIDWFEKTNMLMISNGPFFLTRYDPPAQFAQADAFRAEGYPFKPGDWEFGEPPVLAVERGIPSPGGARRRHLPAGHASKGRERSRCVTRSSIPVPRMRRRSSWPAATPRVKTARSLSRSAPMSRHCSSRASISSTCWPRATSSPASRNGRSTCPIGV